MGAVQILQDILEGNRRKTKIGPCSGIYSVCSTHPEVLKTAIRFAKYKRYPLLIESTSNQVDQYGGYTGMKPAEFFGYVQKLAAKQDFPAERLLLGGDHLGPNAWQNESGEAAMQKAEVLVAEYIRAGYRKIHLDASMACAKDAVGKGGALPDELVANRAARLCRVAEESWQQGGRPGEAPVYVIGTEVPTPGGSKHPQESHTPTQPEAARQTYTITKEIFAQHGLDWSRVVAMVVQPGVEFGDESVIPYQSSRSHQLSALPAELGLVFEAHSTDYQETEHLRQLVADHYAILKVGPWLTYAYREALFSLSHIVWEMQHYGLLSSAPESFTSKVLAHLQAQPEYWQKYYRGSEQQIAYKCLYSLSDRIRYYWPQKEMKTFVTELLARLTGVELPYSLVSQYFPRAIHLLSPEDWSPEALIQMHIKEVLAYYELAAL